MRTITVKGVGMVSAKPDLITVGITVKSKRRGYSEAFKRSKEKIESIEKAVLEAGFSKSDLKTSDFDVNVVERSIEDGHGNWREIFDGYCCTHKLKLEFDFDTDKLGEVLANFAKCEGRPNFDIRFTLKDKTKIMNDLLAGATDDAKLKAQAICVASGVSLGELVTINYAWTGVDIF